MTYNSDKYLREALDALFKTVNVKRLIVVDHYSTDNTISICKEYDAEIYYENIGLGYARQLALDKIETDIFMFLDSDLVFTPPFNWYSYVINRLKTEDNLGIIVMRVSQVQQRTERQQYGSYWHKKVKFTIRFGLTTGSTFIKKEAVEGLQIPSILDAREDRYLELYVLNKKKMKIDYVLCNGIHYFDYAADKGAWGGANERILTGLKLFPYLMMRRIMFAPLKAIPPMLHYRNPNILIWNINHWLKYLKGFLQPYKYRKMKREVKTNLTRGSKK